MYKCVIFDCDGVLVDSLPISNKVLIELLSEEGFQLDIRNILNRNSGTSLQNTLAIIQEKSGRKLPDNFELDFRNRTYARFKSELKPIKGIREILEKLDVPYCVASSGPIEKIELNLSLAGIRHYFGKHVFSSYQINSWKPEPGIFLFAAKEMGFKPEECIVIEDSIDGVRAAKKGNFHVLGFLNNGINSQLKDENTNNFNSMDDLIHLLQTLTSTIA